MKFAVREEGHEPVAYIYYDESTDTYSCDIIKDSYDYPAMMKLSCNKGRYHWGDRFTQLYINERITPYNRQGIGYLLKDWGLASYDVIKIIQVTKLKNVFDDFILEEV